MKILYSIFSIILATLIVIVHINYLADNIQSIKYIFIGGIAYSMIARYLHVKEDDFFSVFFHEISHIIFALLTFAKPHKLVVSPKDPQNGANGFVSYSFKSARFRVVKEYLVSLAPYFFSPLAFVFFMFYWVLVPDGDFILDGITISQITLNVVLFLCGFFYAYNLHISFVQAGIHQSDFHYMGYRKGMFFVVFMQLLFLLFYSLILYSNYGSFEYLYEYILDLYQNIDIDNILFNTKLYIYQEFDVWLNFL